MRLNFVFSTNAVIRVSRLSTLVMVLFGDMASPEKIYIFAVNPAAQAA